MLRKGFTTLLGCMFSLLLPAFAQEGSTRSQGNLREAEELYNRARYDASFSRLEAHATDPASLFLLGRDYYMLGDFPKATQYLKKAVGAAPKNSECADWLGRAYGKRADTSNPLSGVLLERKARAAFERALQLDPKNAEALSDLVLYHLDAPAVLGVGFGKAASVGEKRAAVDSAEVFLEEWKLSPKRKRFQTAGQMP